jgi:5'-nucleotidase
VPDDPWILVTNDDGIDAPPLVPLVSALADLASIRVVVPHIERSWIGKAITRFDPVEVRVVEREGLEMHAATGYPADCVQLGVHTLFDRPPALVVSGINIGYNHGSAFLQSSGTVGAALEAVIAGVDGVAFSAGSDRPWEEWRPWVHTPAARPMWHRLAAIAADITSGLLRAGPTGTVLSVNLPDEAGPTTERRITTVADTGYDRLFRRAGPSVYVHDFGGGTQQRASLEGTDMQAAADRVISITAVRGAHGVPLDGRLIDIPAPPSA